MCLVESGSIMGSCPCAEAINDVEEFMHNNEFWSHFSVFEANDFVKSVRKHFTDSDFTANFSKKVQLEILVTKVDKETTSLKRMQSARQ
jgi:hypothetical protein